MCNASMVRSAHISHIIHGMTKISDRFVLEREIGSGGMSTVYFGTDEVLDRPVAIKVLKPEFMESDIGARFRREGRTAARLSHPNIVQVYDAGEDELDGQSLSYIVMEHVPGGDLRDLISRRGTLSAAEVSNLSGVAAGLAHAHERGVIHRDVKPHNILLDENGQPKLTDFGIARALDATQATRTGMYVGTARYSSPEQLQGKEVTPKSDVYSLGATLYESVTGDPPFSGTPIEIASQHVSKTPTPPGEISPVDGDLEALIVACLAKDPADRPAATQVRRRLAEAASHPGPEQTSAATGPTAVQSSAPSVERPSGTRRQSNRTPLIVALVAVLALLGALGAFTLLRGEDQQAGAPPNTVSQEPTREQNSEPAAEPTTGSPPEETTAEVQQPARQPTNPEPDAPEPENDQPANLVPSQNGSEEQAAAQTVRSAYKLAADDNYGRSYDLLSEGYKRNQFPTQGVWRNTFSTLERISFVEGPDVEVSGDTATVTGVTRAVHTDEIQRNTGTWTLIREDGEWKLDSINVSINVIS